LLLLLCWLLLAVLLCSAVDWSSHLDEWIPKGDARIQPPRSRTEGYTGPSNKRPAQ